jgi:ABC-type multidrug transport system fused ATPase/permease subunit
MFRNITSRIKDFKTKLDSFIELTRLAINIGRKLNSKIIKYDIIEAFVYQTSSALGIVLLGSLLNSITSGDTEYATYILVAIFLNRVIADLIINYTNYKYMYLFHFREIDTFKFMLDKVKEIPVRYRNTPEFIEIEKNADIRKVFQFFGSFISLVSRVYGAVLTLTALTIIQPYILIGALVVGFIAIYLESTSRYKSFSKRKEQDYYSSEDSMQRSNFRVTDLTKLDDNIKIKNNSKFLEDYYFNVFIKKYRNWYQDLLKNVEGKKLWSSNLLDIGTSSAVVIAYNYGISGAIQIGNLVIFAQAYERLMDSIRYLSNNLAIMFENYLNVKAVSDLMNFEVPKTDYKNIENLNRLEIEFKNVSFTYPGTSKKILKNVSFKIDNKDHLGIIGENGAGKSTLIKLLFRIYTPTNGTILINGTDINEVSDEDYYNLFSIMSQNSEIETSLTVEDIIYLGDTSRPKNVKRIIDSAKKAQIHRDIIKMEDGYKQLITYPNRVGVFNKYSEKKYTSLSGGQFRKLILSKIFYSQKPIYVLDEPTDSIDPESAFKIFKHINEIPHAQIVIFITHDVQRLQLASNKVLVLKEGGVIEFGETEKLIKNKKSELNKALDTFQKTIRE